jgi:Putative peptidoglycan binding domain
VKTTGLITLAGTALVALTQPILAVPRDGGGSRGSFGGGHVAGGFSPGHVGGFAGGGARAAPVFSRGGARFSGGSTSTPTRASQQFYYYSGTRTSAVTPNTSSRQLANRSTSSMAGKVARANRQSNRVNSAVGQKRASAPRPSTAENRQAFMKDHAFARHDSSWHRDWDKRRAHFDQGYVFVFIDGFWWGLFPSDYYPYDPYYASDYYPNDYNDYDYYPYGDDDQSAYFDSGEYGNNSTISAVQAQLVKLGYYRGSIDGVAGDGTQAAIARYQEDHDLSVTGTITAATLHALGVS